MPETTFCDTLLSILTFMGSVGLCLIIAQIIVWLLLDR